MIRSLFKVTAWEKAAVGRRLLCAFGRVSVLAAILAVIAYLILAHRYGIEAKVWHWRHGYSTSIGNYVVPVPEHWFILNENSETFTMVNISPKQFQRDGKLHTAAVIDVFPFRDGLVDSNKMDFWESLEKQRLASEGVKTIEERTLKFGDESIACVGGPELNVLDKRPNHPQMEAVSLFCKSGRGLNVLFVGEPTQVQPFYSFLSQIRRKS